MLSKPQSALPGTENTARGLNGYDFLMRKDIKYLEELKGNADAMIEEARAIVRLANASGYQAVAQEAEAIIGFAGAYVAAFEAVVHGTETMGLDRESELQGEFREAAHQLVSCSSGNRTVRQILLALVPPFGREFSEA